MLQGLRVLSLGGLPVDDPLPALLPKNNNKFNLKKTTTNSISRKQQQTNVKETTNPMSATQQRITSAKSSY